MPRSKTPEKRIMQKILWELCTRLTFIAALAAFFLLFVLYVSRNVTYENESGGIPTESTAYPRTLPEETDDGTRILRMSDREQSVGIYRPDGTLEGRLAIASEMLTEYDLALLRDGVSVSRYELASLLEEAEVLIPY